MGGFYPTAAKPGPRDGSSRPANAPNNGAMGGRPPSPGIDASPIERMATTPDPSFYPRTLPPKSGDTMTDGTAGAPVGGAGATPPPGTATAAPAAPPSGGSTININVGGAPATPTPPTNAGGENWPDANAPAPSQAPGVDAVPGGAGAQSKGENWPDLNAPAAPPPPVQLKSSPSTDDLARIPDGSEVITPYATGTKKNGEIAQYHLTPAGQEAHKRATLALRERAGATPFDGDPTAPPILPLVLGKWNYNPWAQPGREFFK